MPKTVIAKDIHGNEYEVAVSDLRWRPSAYAITVRDQKVLLMPEFDGYALPGGEIELGENIEAALEREVKEETGIAVRNPRLLGAETSFFVLPGFNANGNNVQSIMLFYACDYAGGELSDEGFDEEEKNFGGFPEWIPVNVISNTKLVGTANWSHYLNGTDT